MKVTGRREDKIQGAEIRTPGRSTSNIESLHINPYIKGVKRKRIEKNKVREGEYWAGGTTKKTGQKGGEGIRGTPPKRGHSGEITEEKDFNREIGKKTED